MNAAPFNTAEHAASFAGRVLRLCAAAGAAGINAADVLADTPLLGRKAAVSALSRLATRAAVFSAGHRANLRYFTDQAHAAAWHEHNSAAALLAVRIAAKRAKAKAIRAARPKKPASQPVGAPESWTAEQFAILERDFPTHGAPYVAAQIGVSRANVYKVATRRGIVRIKPETTSPPPPPPRKHRKSAGLTQAKATTFNPDCGQARSRAVRGPAFLEGEPIFTDKTRRVVCPSPPKPTRTNTFTNWG